MSHQFLQESNVLVDSNLLGSGEGSCSELVVPGVRILVLVDLPVSVLIYVVSTFELRILVGDQVDCRLDQAARKDIYLHLSG